MAKYSIKQLKDCRIIASLVITGAAIIGFALPAVASASSGVICQVYGVPAEVANGLGVTPTIAVTNNTNSPINATVDGTESLVSKAGSKGGGFEQDITVPANQSFEFKGGTLTAESGYKIKIVAKSHRPDFSCRAVAKVD